MTLTEELDRVLKQEIFYNKYNYKSLSNLKNNLNDLFQVLTVKLAAKYYTKKRILKLVLTNYSEYFDKFSLDLQDELLMVNKLFTRKEIIALKVKRDEDVIAKSFDFRNDIVLGYTFQEMIKTQRITSYVKVKKLLSGKINEGASVDSYKKELKKVMTQIPISQARTIANTYSRHMREETRNQLEESPSGWVSLSTLDSRTSPVCVALDKKVYPAGKYKTRADIEDKPPRHFNCRSILIRNIGEGFTRASKGDEGGQQVNSATSFSSFLRRNPATAKKLLGEQRYELFASGRLSINKFIDVENNRFYSLEELEDIL